MTTSTLRSTLFAGLMALVATGSTLAQTAVAPTVAPSTAPSAALSNAPEAGRHGHAANAQERQARMSAHHAARQAKLHDALKLTSAQEAAWSTYQNAVRSTPHAMGNRGELATLSAPARMEKRLAMAKEHVTRMESHLAALNTFYGVLTTEQKKTFDAASRHMGGKRGWGKHGGHHGKHGAQGAAETGAKPAA